MALSLLTGIVFGLAPSLAASRCGSSRRVREEAAAVGGNSGLRRGLVAAEVALSVALLAGAGLLFRSLIGLQGVDPGLDASGVLTFRVSLPGRAARCRRSAYSFTRRTRADTGATGRAIGQRDQLSSIPRHGCRHPRQHRRTAPAKPGEELVSTIRAVTPGYFQAMHIPIRQGRDFSDADNTVNSPYRFLISESFARAYLPDKQPLGSQINA